MNKINKDTPNLVKDWTIERVYNGDYVLYGIIYNDEKGRFKDGTHIRTSAIRVIDFVEGVVQTKNTVYYLGSRGLKYV